MHKYDAYFSGSEKKAYTLFGVHCKKNGLSFTLPAPGAYKVSLISSFDNWQCEHFLKCIDDRGVFHLFLPKLKPIYSYRYRIYCDEVTFHEKIDPFSYYYELRPANASCMYDLNYYHFIEIEKQEKKDLLKEPLNIYELYLNSFKRKGSFVTFKELEEELIPYLLANNFTHVEILPLFEHPLDASWGYQASGFFAITSRYGTPYDFMHFVDTCHKAKIGVLLDVVYAHFVADDYGLRNYAFAPYYEKSEEKSEWGTYYFDLEKKDIISFLSSSATFYLDIYKVDGLRFDAISHFLYYEGNKNKGLNKEGIYFLKQLNKYLKKNYPNCLLMAEDSSDYLGVTKSVNEGGLGFDLKWDLGWMNDTLAYFSLPFNLRKDNHRKLTFSMYYYYSEHFLLPLSHDEVVHGKKTIIDKMFGDYEQKFASYRTLLVYMLTRPGKKLLFMGNELAQFREFDERKTIDWLLLSYPKHKDFTFFFKHLSGIYLNSPLLSEEDYEQSSFKWIDCNNDKQSVFTYLRINEKEVYIVILNMLPIYYPSFRIGALEGKYEVILNSEAYAYGGSQNIIYQEIRSEHLPYHGYQHSIEFSLPALGSLIIKKR